MHIYQLMYGQSKPTDSPLTIETTIFNLINELPGLINSQANPFNYIPNLVFSFVFGQVNNSSNSGNFIDTGYYSTEQKDSGFEGGELEANPLFYNENLWYQSWVDYCETTLKFLDKRRMNAVVLAGWDLFSLGFLLGYWAAVPVPQSHIQGMNDTNKPPVIIHAINNNTQGQYVADGAAPSNQFQSNQSNQSSQGDLQSEPAPHAQQKLFINPNQNEQFFNQFQKNALELTSNESMNQTIPMYFQPNLTIESPVVLDKRFTSPNITKYPIPTIQLFQSLVKQTQFKQDWFTVHLTIVDYQSLLQMIKNQQVFVKNNTAHGISLSKPLTIKLPFNNATLTNHSYRIPIVQTPVSPILF